MLFKRCIQIRASPPVILDGLVLQLYYDQTVDYNLSRTIQRTSDHISCALEETRVCLQPEASLGQRYSSDMRIIHRSTDCMLNQH